MTAAALGLVSVQNRAKQRCSDRAALGTCWTVVAGACLKALVREKGRQSVARKLCCERGGLVLFQEMMNREP